MIFPYCQYGSSILTLLHLILFVFGAHNKVKQIYTWPNDHEPVTFEILVLKQQHSNPDVDYILRVIYTEFTCLRKNISGLDPRTR